MFKSFSLQKCLHVNSTCRDLELVVDVNLNRLPCNKAPVQKKFPQSHEKEIPQMDEIFVVIISIPSDSIPWLVSCSPALPFGSNRIRWIVNQQVIAFMIQYFDLAVVSVYLIQFIAEIVWRLTIWLFCLFLLPHTKSYSTHKHFADLIWQYVVRCRLGRICCTLNILRSKIDWWVNARFWSDIERSNHVSLMETNRSFPQFHEVLRHCDLYIVTLSDDMELQLRKLAWKRLLRQAEQVHHGKTSQIDT